MRQRWTTRKYRAGDEQSMFRLHCATYGTVDETWWMKRWKWLYQQNPAGSPIIWLAESDGKIVGQYPLNRVRMKIRHEVIEGSQIMDLMTHPDYRRQGIRQALAELALSDACNKGISITYGFPNKAAYHGHLVSGYADVGSISAMIKPLGTAKRLLLKVGSVACRAREVPEVDGLSIAKVPCFDGRINTLWAGVSGNYCIMVRRNMIYLNWRYTGVPDADYTIYLAEKEGNILGYTVLKCEEQLGLTVGRIFELVVIAGKKAIVQSLLLKAIEFFKEEKADIVLYRFVGDEDLRRVLCKSGFIYSRLVSRKAHFVAYSHTDHIPRAFIENPEHWFVQTGDSDAI